MPKSSMTKENRMRRVRWRHRPNTSSLPFVTSIGSLPIGPAPVILALPSNGTTKPKPLTYLCPATSPLPYTASSIRYPPPNRIHLMLGSSRPTAPPSNSHLLRTLAPFLTPKAPPVSNKSSVPYYITPTRLIPPCLFPSALSPPLKPRAPKSLPPHSLAS